MVSQSLTDSLSNHLTILGTFSSSNLASTMVGGDSLLHPYTSQSALDAQ